MNFDIFYKIVQPLSITSYDRIQRLYSELENIRISNIEGDLVECGVYKGGNILGMMEYCYFHKLNKKIWIEKLEQVKNNLSISLYKNIQYVIGDVCETLKILDNIPNKISLLRLDTDWFESTLCELNILFPKLAKEGSLIIDDYGHWKGCKEAVDTYFKNTFYQFHKIDYTGIYLRK